MATQTNATDYKLVNGPTAAALLAGGIGAFAVGLMTVLGESIKAVGNFLNFYAPVGPLSGKTAVAVVIWLVSWFALSRMWSKKTIDFEKIALIATTLLVLGILGTFPPVFEFFAGG